MTHYFSDYYLSALNRRKREWDKHNTLEDKSKIYVNNDDAVTDVFNDLAITGQQASLDKLFSMMHGSDAWEKKWFSWISSPATENKINIRQQAVKELMGKRL
ncbi:MAG TPA: hypothetical protein EYG71_07920 [Leucothrix sp.]|nr:hypothetical protein [Leucothrix sp.]